MTIKVHRFEDETYVEYEDEDNTRETPNVNHLDKSKNLWYHKQYTIESKGDYDLITIYLNGGDTKWLEFQATRKEKTK